MCPSNKQDWSDEASAIVVGVHVVTLEQRCVVVDQRCRESEGKAKIEGHMSISDEEAHHRFCGGCHVAQFSSFGHHLISDHGCGGLEHCARGWIPRLSDGKGTDKTGDKATVAMLLDKQPKGVLRTPELLLGPLTPHHLTWI